MFSDIIVLHGQNVSPTTSASNLLSVNIDKKNVCSSEKTTQAGKIKYTEFFMKTDKLKQIVSKTRYFFVFRYLFILILIIGLLVTA